ncbi:sensor histidine kinase [Nocardia sp. NPDC059240]|uniref:sensor histidine kinase n=1 Tax=Nocardia sp. NPDC059240 TaxID=3346786 RepID=UPI0036B476C0
MSTTRRIGSTILDVVLAALFGWVGYSEVHTSSIGLLPAAAGPPVAIAVGFALLLRRYRPMAVLVAAGLGQMLVGATAPMLVAMYAVGRRYGNRRVTWLASTAAIVVAVVPWGAPNGWYVFFSRSAVVVPMLIVPLLWGLWANQRAETLAALRERAEQAERERDLRAAAAVEAERLRIAGELHDIVAHRISQITVLAGALEVSAEGKPAEIAATIRATGSRALTEMRELLGLLRAPEGAVEQDDSTADRAPLRPAPDLTSITELVEVAVAAGQRVEFTAPVELPPVTGPVGRAAYRVVQEALTNAAKHAAGAEVRAALGVVGDRLDIDVRNGRGDATALAASGSGFGLVGMRKRVELAGGALHSGPLAAGGYRVHATFPLDESDSVDE